MLGGIFGSLTIKPEGIVTCHLGVQQILILALTIVLAVAGAVLFVLQLRMKCLRRSQRISPYDPLAAYTWTWESKFPPSFDVALRRPDLTLLEHAEIPEPYR